MWLLFIQLIVGAAQAAPKELEVWFLTPPKTAMLERWMAPMRPAAKQIAEAACEQIGDYCFDPQLGLYKKEGTNPLAESIDPADVKLDSDLPLLPSASSVDRSLISCDPKYAFDMFCGKAVPEAVKKEGANLEIWIDTSSSMREMDWPDAQGHCHRETFLKRLDIKCGFQKKASVMMYDVSLREMGTMASACQSVGQNDTARLMDWIERSNANEYTKKFGDFIETHHGKIKGDRGSFPASEIVNLADSLNATCL